MALHMSPERAIAAANEERDQALTRAEAAETTLRAVCKALGCDADSAEAQAAMLVREAERQAKRKARKVQP